MCRLGRRIIGGFIIIVLSMVVLYSLIQFKVLLDIEANHIYQEIKILNQKYTQLVSNDMELISMIQENRLIQMKKELEDVQQKQKIEAILNSSVYVRGMFGQGAGTVIKKTENRMYVLTCYHVINDIIIFNKNGIGFSATVGYSKNDTENRIAGIVSYKAKVVEYDEDVDLALLVVNFSDKDLNSVPIAETEPCKGDIIYSVGNPLGILRTISKGILSAKDEGFYICDNTTTYGNSGGGLFNANGELIGVPSNVTGYSAGLNENGEETFIPESGLGLARDLITIRTFLALIDY